jgi:hypothetical protein
MAYFNSAFKKTIIMNTFVPPVAGTTTTADLQAGEVSIFDARTLRGADLTDPCCQLIIAAGPHTRANDGSVDAALTYAGGSDKIGPFHGGYQESIKTKGIQAKYLNNFYVQDSNAAQPYVLNIGTTITTIADGTENCCPTFLCGEQYHLRVDVKGDAVLRTLNHQGYVEVTADGGCCPDDEIDPVEVDPALIMIQWAEGIWRNAIVTGNGPNFNGATTGNAATRFNERPFMIPVVQLSPGAGGGVPGGVVTTLLYPPGTDAAVLAAAALVPGVTTVGTWDEYGTATIPSTFTIGNGDCAGMSLQTAYLDTRFGDCTFQTSDYYGLEPIRIYASQVDLNGDPCAFEGICVTVECPGRQAQGLGETAARDLILSESYRQNFFSSDLRIREITQGNLMLGGGPGQVDRTILYDRTMILHSVPRFNNPTGTFDNDQYLVEILTPATGALGALGIAARDAFRDVFDDGAGAGLLVDCPQANCIVEPQLEQVACAAPSVPVVV